MDYKEIIDNLKIESVIELMKRLGADRYKDEGTHLIFPTICHHEDSEEASMKLYFYKNSKTFVCFTSCGTMSIFKFLKHYYETRDYEYDWVNDIYNVILDCSSFRANEGFAPPKRESLQNKYGKINRQVVLSEYGEGALDTFVHYYPPEWLDDGISKAAMDKFGIRYSISQNKIIIPHRDINGRLIGIRGRVLNEWEIENVGKYMPIKLEQTWFKHPLSMNLYGLYENKNNIRRRGICFVAEGEKSVLQSESFSFPNCTVATCGSAGINKYQLNLLLQNPGLQEIVLCYDNEEVLGEDKYFNKLYGNCKKYCQYVNMSFVYARRGEIGLKQSPFDRGEEVFQQLFARRVRINNH